MSKKWVLAETIWLYSVQFYTVYTVHLALFFSWKNRDILSPMIRLKFKVYCTVYFSLKPIKTFIKNKILFFESYFRSLIDLIKALNVLTCRHHVVFRESRIVNIPPLRRLQSPQVGKYKKILFFNSWVHLFLVLLFIHLFFFHSNIFQFIFLN